MHSGSDRLLQLALRNRIDRFGSVLQHKMAWEGVVRVMCKEPCQVMTLAAAHIDDEDGLVITCGAFYEALSHGIECLI